MASSNQYELLSLQQQQQLLGQAHVQGNVGNSHGYREMDPRLRALQRGGLNVKDGSPTGNDGQVGSMMQPSSPMVRQDQVEYLMKVSYIKDIILNLSSTFWWLRFLQFILLSPLHYTTTQRYL